MRIYRGRRTNHRGVRLRTAALVLLVGILAQCSETPPARNLVMIVMDTLRADALGLYGNPLGASPNVDAFGRESVVFEHAWAQGTYTTPSFLSYMTSTHVRTHGWDSDVFSQPEVGICAWDDLETLAEVLSRNGFTSIAYVANPVLVPKLGFPRGFDTWNEIPVDSLSDIRAMQVFQYSIDDRAVVKGAEKSLHGWEPQERNFLYLHLMTPHLPLRPSKQAGRRLNLPEDWIEDGELDVHRVSEWAQDSTPEQRRLSRQAYHATVWDGDRHLKKILLALDESGHRDDSIVVFLSDHGEKIWEHGDYGHDTGVWEQLAHVPLVIRAPGVPAARVTERAVGLLDVAPTVLYLLGVDERPASWQGENLFSDAKRRAVFTERLRQQAVTFDGRKKGIVTRRHRGGIWRFFDLEADPTEQRELDDPEAEDEFEQAHSAWKTSTPRVERALDAAPIGICGKISDAEQEAHREQLRALGYVE